MSAQRFSIEDTSVEGCKIINVPLYEDVRGVFMESWNEELFVKNKLPIFWPQDNFSTSHKGVARGMHIQRRNPQGKLVRCLTGQILDICLDLRVESPTFGKTFSVELWKGTALYLPPGTAHGFIALTDCTVYYKCTSLYNEQSDGGVNMNDPLLGLSEFTEGKIMSEKDKNLPGMYEWLEGRNK